jgi:catechol 2,3-dioxygenase
VNAPANPDNATGIDYFTIVYASKEQLDQALEQLRHSGAVVTQVEGTWFTVDPQNIRVRLTAAN